jgi:large subunit ribosomal protein L23
MTNISTDRIIILKPRVTEKTAILQEEGVYTFDISADANKQEVKKEIKRLYKVTPVKVNIAKTEAKKVFTRGRFGKKKGVKKAYVFLKKGEKITL